MSAVLGLSAHYHDAAAAMFIDGVISSAIQEERLSRIKNDPSLPVRAARACLAHAGLGARDLDAVVFYENPYAKLERVVVDVMANTPRSWRLFPRALGSQLGSKLWVLDQIADALDVDRARVEFVSHHQSHAASAFYVSPFDRAAVLVVDAVGERESTSVWRGNDRELDALARIEYPHSLGLFYAALTAYLGLPVNEGEYIVMGLAAYGTPRFEREFDKLIEIGDDGAYQLGLAYFAHHSDVEMGFGPALERLLGPRRRPGAPWDLSRAEDQRFADVAATAQAAVERALLALARRARSLTSCSDLCLAGGVALNCVANARLAAEAGFERVFVQPAAGDAGGALGAALLGSLARGDGRPTALSCCALGLPIDPGRALAVAESMGMRARRVDDPVAITAEAIERGRLVAVASGRFEWGPRALGQRSLLADPRRGESADQLNRVVKRREPFRPFAPAVLAGSVDQYFEGGGDEMTPFMTTVRRVREAAALPAVTHVDGTARVQTVTPDSAPWLWSVLDALGERTGVPAVLNTSLNGRGEPIAGSAEDVVAFFARHPVDLAVIEDVVLERRPG